MDYSEIFTKNGVIILVDGILYANNAGTLIRNTSLLGAKSLIFSPLDQDRISKIKKKNKGYMLKGFTKFNNNYHYTKTFIKSTERYSSRIYLKTDIHFNLGVKEVLNSAIENDYDILMLEDYVEADIAFTNLKAKKLMFILGNETLGVGKEVKKFYDAGYIKPLYIPSCLKGSTSYNVANAGIIAMYERFRQVGCEK